MAFKIANLLAFQIAWFATVVSAGSGMPWVGPLLTCIWVPIHLKLIRNHYKHEILLIGAAILFGFITDSLLVLTDFIRFPLHTPLGFPTSPWMLALWVNVAVTINYSLAWLRGRYLFAGLFASIGGPLAYFTGSRFSAIELVHEYALIMVSVQWIICLPLLFLISDLSHNRFRLYQFGKKST
jgi:hypothetical protein